MSGWLFGWIINETFRRAKPARFIRGSHEFNHACINHAHVGDCQRVSSCCKHQTYMKPWIEAISKWFNFIITKSPFEPILARVLSCQADRHDGDKNMGSCRQAGIWKFVLIHRLPSADALLRAESYKSTKMLRPKSRQVWCGRRCYLVII